MSVADIKRSYQDLLDKRANLWETEGKPLVDIAVTREYTADEATKSANVEAAFVRFDRAIAQTKDQLKAQEQRDALGLEKPNTRDTGHIAAELRAVLTEKTKAATEFAFTNGDWDRAMKSRALGSGTGSDGAGATIPLTLWPEFITPLRDSVSVIDAGARVIVTTSGEAIQVPYQKLFGAAETNTESQTLAGTDPTFGQVAWNVAKYDEIIYAPRELIEDSIIDIEGLIGSLVGLNVGLKIGAATSTATATAVTVGVTGAAGVFTPTMDQIIDLEHSLLRPYRKNAVFLANDIVTASVRKLKDTVGQYLWQPAVQIGQPDMLHGKAYLADAFIASPASGAVPLMYGDFQRGVWVRMVGALRIERSDQAAWAKDQIGFKGILRSGSAVVDANAIKSYKSGA